MSFTRLHKPAGTPPPVVRQRGVSTSPPTATSPTRSHDISRVPLAAPIQRRAVPGAAPGGGAHQVNRTGLPDGLKAGLESISGMSMDAVRVHYGSPEPARIQAHAFADGTNIHLAPGQERHLPHEAWHVVQQAEGRVRPTLDLGGTAVNDDPGLEREADRMGDASAALGRTAASGPAAAGPASPVAAPQGGTVQGVFDIKAGALKGSYKTSGGKDTNALVDAVKLAIGDDLASGWIGNLRGWAGKGEGPYGWDTTVEFLDFLLANYGKVAKDGKTRPNFSSIAYKLAKITYGIQTGVDQSAMSPSDEDLAMPHRFPYAGIELSVALFISNKEDDNDLKRWTDRLYTATVKRANLNLPLISDKNVADWYRKSVQAQLDEMVNARAALILAKSKGETLTLSTPVVQRMLKAANNMHGNIPDYGPHSKINIPVSNRLHLHVVKPDDWDEDDDDMQAPMSPGSYYAAQMSPHRVDKGVAYDEDGEYVVGTDGYGYDPSRIEGFEEMMEEQEHKVGKTTISSSNLMDF